MALGPLRFSSQRVLAALSALVLLLATLLLAGVAPAAAQAPSTFTVERARVYWQPTDAATPEQITRGLSQEVAPGGTIVVDGLGRAVLYLGTDARVTIYPNSRVKIDALAAQTASLSMVKGTIYLDTSPKGAPFTVTLSGTSVQAAGRVFVYHNDRDKSTWVVVKQGKAEVTGGVGTVALSNRQQTWATGGAMPAQAQPANRQAVGARFFLVDDLTNRAMSESDLFAPEFPWWAVALAGGAVAVTGGVLVVRRRRVTASAPAEGQAVPVRSGTPPPSVPAQAKMRPGALEPPGEQAILYPAELTIGRVSDNRLILDDSRVSAHHARILASESGYLIEDLNSTNGTFVNDARITRASLRDGDKIRLGGPQFVFRAADMVLLPIAVAAGEQSPQPGHPDAWIEILEADGTGRRSRITGEQFTIGRYPDNDLILQNSTVSRHHATISRVAGRWAIEDLDSASGVWVDGTQVLRALLTSGAQIRLGEVRLMFHARSQTEEEVAS